MMVRRKHWNLGRRGGDGAAPATGPHCYHGSVRAPAMRARHRWRRGFTLIELLVVVAIIAVVLGLIYPVVLQARRQSLRTSCTTNLRNLYVAFQAYCDEYGGWRNAPRYLSAIEPYAKDIRVMHCDADPRPTTGTRFPLIFGCPWDLPPYVRYPVSYYYIRHFEPWDSAYHWRWILARAARLGILACPWHGHKCRNQTTLVPFVRYCGSR
ncbi:MAG: hypothetical protein AMXMBFR61_05900 [Fimbriimonadales bacterium]